MKDIKRQEEYKELGDYHKQLDKKWPYLPVFVEKFNYIDKYLTNTSKDIKILDLGCGEGIFVEKYKRLGYNIEGLDMNYSSEYVKQGNLLSTDYPDKLFDLILCLDVLEHLEMIDQQLAVKEINRLLKDDGKVIISVPNLAHFASRVKCMFTGKPIRTAIKAERHPGDRPIREYLSMFEKYFEVTKRKGYFPTFPIISILTWYIPSKIIWLHKIYNRVLAYPNWCFLNIIELKKKNEKN